MYVNGRQIPSDSLSLDINREKTSVKGYATLFEGTGIHHSNSGFQITRMYINGFFVIVYDLTPDLSASEGQTNVTPYKRRYQDRFEIRQGTTLSRNMSFVSRV
jgi:hypothetical protein